MLPVTLPASLYGSVQGEREIQPNALRTAQRGTRAHAKKPRLIEGPRVLNTSARGDALRVLDDWGKEKATDRAKERFLKRINFRSEHRLPMLRAFQPEGAAARGAIFRRRWTASGRVVSRRRTARREQAQGPRPHAGSGTCPDRIVLRAPGQFPSRRHAALFQCLVEIDTNV